MKNYEDKYNKNTTRINQVALIIYLLAAILFVVGTVR